MVGYDPNKTNLSAFQLSYVTASASILSRFFIQPLDVVKIRFQLQHEPISERSLLQSKYTSIDQCMRTIYKEEGLLSLWKGHLTGQFLSLSYNSSQFLWFEAFTRLSQIVYPDALANNRNKLITHFACGGLGAFLTILTVQPIDVVRTRLVSQGEPKVYNGIFDAIKRIKAKEGIRGFYKGTVPALMLTTPETALRFAAYQLLNSIWERLALSNTKSNKHQQQQSKQVLTSKNVGSLQSSVNGALAGLTAKALTYPFDLAKKRLQVQGFEKARIQFGRVVAYSGLLNCLSVTIRNEGLTGLYKGVTPSILKAAISSGLIFFFYEQFSNLVRRR